MTWTSNSGNIKNVRVVTPTTLGDSMCSITVYLNALYLGMLHRQSWPPESTTVVYRELNGAICWIWPEF